MEGKTYLQRGQKKVFRRLSTVDSVSWLARSVDPSVGNVFKEKLGLTCVKAHLYITLSGSRNFAESLLCAPFRM